MNMARDRILLPVVAALGLTQIVGYGTLYYSFGILAPSMARDFGWTADQVFGIYSGALLVGGVVAPVIGGWMDRFGAGRLMTYGSAAAALTLAFCACSTSAASFTAATILLMIASGTVQYQAAFASLVEIRPQSAAASITWLTLIAGFSSTLFWPITSGLHAHFGWRDIYLGYALLNILICLPLHYWITRGRATDGEEAAARSTGGRVIGAVPLPQRRRAFLLVSAGFALQSFALSAMLVHMVPMLTTLGLVKSAVAIGAIFGPSQVLSRFVNMLFGRSLKPPALALVSASFIVGGVAVLAAAGPWLPGALGFAILLGLGSGLNSIAQGSLPLWLFGSEGYGTTTGKISSVRLLTGATAPFIFAMLGEYAGTRTALAVTALLGATGLLAFATLQRLVSQTENRESPTS